MLARSERQLIRVYGHTNTRPTILSSLNLGRQSSTLRFRVFLSDCVARRASVLGNVNRPRLAPDDVVKVLAVNYVNGFRQWQSTQTQHRNVSTETHPPDTKPFPLPTTTQQPQSNTSRAPPPPMPPQIPRTEPPKKPESVQPVSADSAKSDYSYSDRSDSNN